MPGWQVFHATHPRSEVSVCGTRAHVPVEHTANGLHTRSDVVLGGADSYSEE